MRKIASSIFLASTALLVSELSAAATITGQVRSAHVAK
jgi:hypothetical protein